MDIFYYITMFMMGTVFGSFFTLAVYRIPLKKDITHERSFCPICNHKLGFWDMIPILSYLIARGKCRYCGEKIRIRYLILSGMVFLTEYIALNMHFPYLNFGKIVFFISFIFMYVTIAILSGIDKENRNIHKGVLIFGFIMQGLYILYLYIVQKTNMYRYGMYLCIMIVLYIIDIVSIKKTGKSKYILQVLMLYSYIGAVLNVKLLGITILLALVIAFFNYLHKKTKYEETRFGFLLGMSAICIAIVNTFITYM